MAKIAIIQSLQRRSFAWLWSGQSISALGDSLYRITLAWWVLQVTGSATIMGIVLLCSFAPMLLLLVVGGVTVDRLPRLQVMLLSDLLRGGIVAAIAILGFSQRLEVWHIYIASILFGIVDAFFQPAYAAALPELVPSEMLPSANSLTVLSRQTFSVVGPSIGAVVIAFGSVFWGFAFDSVSFFISALCIIFAFNNLLANPVPLKKAETEVAKPASTTMLEDFRAGIGLVLGTPWIWITILVSALANITQSSPFSVSLPFLVSGPLHQNVGTLGIIYSTYFFGSVIGALVMGSRSKISRRGFLAYALVLLSGLMSLSLGLPFPLIVLLATVLLRGFAFTAFELIWTNMLQEFVPHDALGRVASIDYLGSFALLPIGYVVAGSLTDQVGPQLVFVVGGSITVIVALLGFVHPAVRRVD